MNWCTNQIMHTFKYLVIIRGIHIFKIKFIPQCIEINGICFRRCAKGCRFKTLFAPL